MCKMRSSPRPSDNHVQALYLHETDFKILPRLIWLEKTAEGLNLSQFSDQPFARTAAAPEVSGSGTRTPTFLATQPLDSHVHVLNRPLFENCSIAGIVPAHPWSGPCLIVTEQANDGEITFVDFSWRDLRPMLATLSQTGDHWGVLAFKKPHSTPEKMIVGAILACQAEIQLLGTKPSEPVELFFTNEEPSHGV